MYQLSTPVIDIVDVVDCHQGTVKRWFQRYEETLDVKRRLGRMWSTSKNLQIKNFSLMYRSNRYGFCNGICKKRRAMVTASHL